MFKKQFATMQSQISYTLGLFNIQKISDNLRNLSTFAYLITVDHTLLHVQPCPLAYSCVQYVVVLQNSI